MNENKYQRKSRNVYVYVALLSFSGGGCGIIDVL